MSELGISATINDSFKVTNRSRGHVWLGDEPEDVGGTDLGPRPTELLLSSLASCKLITMKMYGDRKGWNIRDLQIDLQIVDRNDGLTLKKSFVFPSHLNEEQRNRLREISDRCPVSKLLKNSVRYTE